MTDSFRIMRADASHAAALAEITLDCVAGGASIGFMNPLSMERALAFWQTALSDESRQVMIAVDDSGELLGTVSLLLAMPDNQPHRADVAKMQVHRKARRRGVGEALLKAIEEAAKQAGRTLLVLDTVSGSDAERLYLRCGWQRVGEIPGYAFFPDGGLCSTTVFYRTLA